MDITGIISQINSLSNKMMSEVGGATEAKGITDPGKMTWLQHYLGQVMNGYSFCSTLIKMNKDIVGSILSKM